MAINKKRKGHLDHFENGDISKRLRHSYGPNEQDSGRVESAAAKPDLVTGMRAAFPGLDDINGDEKLFYGPANDGLEYLRMVRTEAKSVPYLLVAPRSKLAKDPESEVYQEIGGYYADGAYTAAPSAASDANLIRDQDAHDIYYQSLRDRFQTLRSNLISSPPPEAMKRLDKDHPTYCSANDHKAFSRWRHLLKTTDPIPAQVTAMDQKSVLRLVRILTTSYMKKTQNIDVRTSRWVWALLAKVKEVGCLDSDEVSVIRELGKKAVGYLAAINSKGSNNETFNVYAVDEDEVEDATFIEKNIALLGEVNDIQSENTSSTESNQNRRTHDEKANTAEETISSSEEGEIIETVEESLAAAQTRILGQLSATTAIDDMTNSDTHRNKNTLATLDTIITVVAEFFGQRDLLEFRATLSNLDRK